MNRIFPIKCRPRQSPRTATDHRCLAQRRKAWVGYIKVLPNHKTARRYAHEDHSHEDHQERQERRGNLDHPLARAGRAGDAPCRTESQRDGVEPAAGGARQRLQAGQRQSKRNKTKSLQKATQEALEDALTDPQLSQSLLRGLAILSSYGPERPWRAIIDLAHQLGMSPSTTHRYVKTLRAVGLLEQNPTTREYRPVAH